MGKDITRERKGQRRGRRTISGATKGPDKGDGALIQLKIDPELFPNIRELLLAKSPQDLEERYGLSLDRDLPWPQGDKKTQSIRAGAILETIARRGLQKGGAHA
jgi:hypothetical protein